MLARDAHCNCKTYCWPLTNTSSRRGKKKLSHPWGRTMAICGPTAQCHPSLLLLRPTNPPKKRAPCLALLSTQTTGRPHVRKRSDASTLCRSSDGDNTDPRRRSDAAAIGRTFDGYCSRRLLGERDTNTNATCRRYPNSFLGKTPSRAPSPLRLLPRRRRRREP